MNNEGIVLGNKLRLEGFDLEIDRVYGAYFDSGIKTQEEFTNLSEATINSNDVTDEQRFGKFYAFKQDENYPNLLERVYREGAILKLGATDTKNTDMIRILHFFVSPKEIR